MMVRVQDDPARRCLKVAEWPELDQQNWRAILRQGELLDDDGPAADWSPATIEKRRKGNGRWLGWLIENEMLDEDEAPWQRVTTERVAQYVKDLQSQVSPYTVIGRLNELVAVMAAMAPGEDWTWLRRAISSLSAQHPRGREKRSRLRPSRILFETALKELRRIEAEEPAECVHAAIRYRDTLMLAFLAARPLRRSNLAAIRVGTHLIAIGDGYKLVFEAHEMKNRRPFEIGLNQRLVPFMARYIAERRPLLLKDKETDRLWINYRRQPMSGQAIYHHVTKTTKTLFGHSINPHLFRDAMATSVAIEDPEHVRIIMVLNGHSSLRTDERHYIQAGSIDAGRQYHAMIRERRRPTKRRHKGGRPE